MLKCATLGSCPSNLQDCSIRNNMFSNFADSSPVYIHAKKVRFLVLIFFYLDPPQRAILSARGERKINKMGVPLCQCRANISTTVIYVDIVHYLLCWWYQKFWWAHFIMKNLTANQSRQISQIRSWKLCNTWHRKYLVLSDLYIESISCEIPIFPRSVTLGFLTSDMKFHWDTCSRF